MRRTKGDRAWIMAPRHRVFIAFCFTFAAFCIAAWFLLPESGSWLETDEFVWRAKTDHLARGFSAHTVILGDSQAMSGILPPAGVYNLALPSQQPEGVERMARDVGQVRGLRRVIINVSPFFLFKSEVLQSFLSYYRNTYDWSFADLNPDLMPLSGKNTGDSVYRMIRFLPVLRLRDRMSPALASADPISFVAGRKETNLKIEKILNDQRGFWVWKSTDQTCNADIPPPPPMLLAYADRPGAVESLERSVQGLRARGLEVFLVYIPLSDVWASLALRGTDDRVIAVMRRMEKVGSVTLPIADRAQYKGLFRDWTHLNRCGAEKFTSWLFSQSLLQN